MNPDPELMDPRNNPFAPGAGSQPPELAGRTSILESADIALHRIMRGRPARGQILLGLRGVGKTVLLNRISAMAESQSYLTITLEAPEDRSLAEMLVQPLRSRLFSLSHSERARAAARRALGVLRAFAGAFRVKVGDVEFSVDPDVGTADSGDLESDLPDLFVEVAKAAQDDEKAIALFIDEVQYLSSLDLAALIVAVHRVTQRGLPLVFFGAGLPQLAGLAGDAKSYAERLFEFVEIGPLDAPDAVEAIRAPIEREGASITDEALRSIVDDTKGYPYFLQEWGFHAWNIASGPTIARDDATMANQKALEHLDRGFFRVRFDRLTPREKDYVRAMAELGAGPHRSGEIARALGIQVRQAGSLRNHLIKKGMIYGPQHGETAFTVPMFDAFMRRTMPDWKPAPDGANSNQRG